MHVHKYLSVFCHAKGLFKKIKNFYFVGFEQVEEKYFLNSSSFGPLIFASVRIYHTERYNEVFCANGSATLSP